MVRIDPYFSPIVPVIEGLEWVVGLEWRGSTVEVVVDWVFGAAHPQYGEGSPRRGVLRWLGVTELHSVGEVRGVLGELAGAGEVYKLRAGSGVLTVKADRVELEF